MKKTQIEIRYTPGGDENLDGCYFSATIGLLRLDIPREGTKTNAP